MCQLKVLFWLYFIVVNLVKCTRSDFKFMLLCVASFAEYAAAPPWSLLTRPTAESAPRPAAQIPWISTRSKPVLTNSPGPSASINSFHFLTHERKSRISPVESAIRIAFNISLRRRSILGIDFPQENRETLITSAN